MNRRFFSIVGMVFLMISGASGCRSPEPEDTTVTIDPAIEYQVITGWAATAQSGELSKGYPAYQKELQDLAVNDLGINRVRLEARSGLENTVDYFAQWQAGKITAQQFSAKRHEVINDNVNSDEIDETGFHFSEMDSTIDKVVLPLKKLLESRGESLYVNLNFIDFDEDRGDSNMRHNLNPPEYAEFMLAVFQHMQKKYGFVPDSIEIVLEPDTGTGWTGKQIGETILATSKRLKPEGFEPSFIAPSVMNAANAPQYIEGIVSVPGARELVSEYSYHRYRGASVKLLEDLAARAKREGKTTSMLEWIGADYESLHMDLKRANVSAWQQYTLAYPAKKDNGAQYFWIERGDPPKVTLGKRTRYLRQYFKYVRAGARRIEAKSTNQKFDPVAFVNKDGRHVVIVKTKVPGTITIRGLPAGDYGVFFTTESETKTESDKIEVVKGRNAKVVIPSPGVITVHGLEALQDTSVEGESR